MNNNFRGINWKNEINVFDFIKENYKEYTGDKDFLKGTTEKTNKIWSLCKKALKEELSKGILGVETEIVSGINNFKPGYIDKKNEIIIGLQTDQLLKRIVNPFGGLKVAIASLEAYGYKLNPILQETFTKYRKTHNDGVFDAYTSDIRKARSSGLITGLPDAYGRGRIIGDYRRVALYGIDYLVNEKERDLDKITEINEEKIRLREEVKEQINALIKTKEMAAQYGFDITTSATSATEAVQWLYFAYLAAIKENNGAAMSLGRTSTFIDIYIERDLEMGTLTEETAQELIDQFIIKLRVARHLRAPEYNELFAGDPTWVTEAIGGMLTDKKSLVTKTSFRFLNTLINLEAAPEPNLTVLWDEGLPINFKNYCSEISIKTASIQYENDKLMRTNHGSDYGIACCVSSMTIGKQLQFFGARCNIAKALLYAINGGVDEITGKKVIKGIPKINTEYLNYNEIIKNFDLVMTKLAKTYVDAMNIIHFMHDKYAYEASQLALHDTNLERLMAFGIAGLSVATDSLSAIKYAKVKTIKNSDGIVVDFEITGKFPKFGNDEDKVDDIAIEITETFFKKLKKYPLYRKAKHTMSILTITSNVVYGKKTGSTPDGRKLGEAFAPGANPMHGRDEKGAIASLNSVAKLPYKNACEDGISNTFSIVPSALGHDLTNQKQNLTNILDGYFEQGAHHLNVNVFNREVLIDAMENPENYPTLTIRVSGYAVNFNRLSKDHQLEVINRTFHKDL